MSLYELFTGAVLIALMLFLSFRVRRKSKARIEKLRQLEKNGTDVHLTILSMKSTDLRLEGKFVLDLKLEVESLSDKSRWIIESYQERAARLALGSYHKDVVYLGKMGDSKEDVIFYKDESERPVVARNDLV